MTFTIDIPAQNISNKQQSTILHIIMQWNKTANISNCHSSEINTHTSIVQQKACADKCT